MPAIPIKSILPEIRILADDMMATLKKSQGVGLAAQQIGSTRAICVIDMPLECDYEEEDGPRLNPDVAFPLVLLNPEIIESTKRMEDMDEGCLSFPDIRGSVKRHWGVRVRYLGLDGQTHEQDFCGFLARIAQHELEHLAGKVFINRFSHVKKLALRTKLRRLKQDTEERIQMERDAAPPEYTAAKEDI